MTTERTKALRRDLRQVNRVIRVAERKHRWNLRGGWFYSASRYAEIVTEAIQKRDRLIEKLEDAEVVNTMEKSWSTNDD